MKIGDKVALMSQEKGKFLSYGIIKKISPTCSVVTLQVNNGPPRRYFRQGTSHRYVYEPGSRPHGNDLNACFFVESLVDEDKV